MVSFAPLASAQKTSTSALAVPSKIPPVSPQLTPVAYLLGSGVVLPLYLGRIKVVGQEYLPKSGPVILAPTHRSRWDALLVPHIAGRNVTGRDLRFLVSEDEMQGIQGWFIRRLGGFPVDTKRPTIASLRYGVEVLHAEETLVIFPEGNIFRDQQIHPLKPGLARLAIQAEVSRPGLGIKVVPIAIHYSQSFPGWGCDVSIRIGTPLEVIPYTTSPAKQAAKHLTIDLEAALKNLFADKTVDPSVTSANSMV